MENKTKFDYAIALLNIKSALSKEDFTSHELQLIDILVSKLIERQDASCENKSIIYRLKDVSDFSRILKSERLSYEYQQMDFARIFNMDKANYCRLENGKLNITLSKFLDICNKLNLDIIIQGLPF